MNPRTAVTTPTAEDLATIINAAHADAQSHAKGMLLQAHRAGEALIQAKQLCTHGQFKHWVEMNCQCSYRTARVYMQVAKAEVADLCQFDSITAFLNAHTASRAETMETTEPAALPTLPEPVKAATPVKHSTKTVEDSDDADPEPSRTSRKFAPVQDPTEYRAEELATQLVGIERETGTDLFVSDFVRGVSHHYFIGVAYEEMVRQLRGHLPVNRALDHGIDALRAMRAAILETVTDALDEAVARAVTDVQSKVEANPILSSPGLDGKMLAIALDGKANPNERITAAEKLLSRADAPKKKEVEDPKEDDTPTSIFDGKLDEESKIRFQVAELIGIECENIGNMFIEDFKKSSKPDYLVGLARGKLIEELRAGRDPKDALAESRRVIRDEEYRIKDELENMLLEMGQRAMKSFMKQTDDHKLLNDPTAGKLLQRALDTHSSSVEERRAAVRALQARSLNRPNAPTKKVA